MAQGRLVPPNLDDRTWREIVKQVMVLIPTYAPEWTDHNPSDLGMALIELFAWLVEGLTYRLNRVPEKNLIEFLNLVGITRDPATPASTLLVYRSASGTPPLLVVQGSQAATQQTETEAAIVFESDRDLTVLPLNLTAALLVRQVGAAQQYQNVTTSLVSSPLSGQLALESDSVILLGFDAATTETIALRLRFSHPAPPGAISIQGRYSNDAGDFSDFAIPPENDGTDNLQKNGIISVTVPTNWTSQNPQSWSAITPPITPQPDTEAIDRPLFWFGIVVTNLAGQPLEIELEYVLFNSVPATNALTIAEAEFVGTSTGEPFQFFELQNAPLFKQPLAEKPYDHLRIQVREPLVGGGFGAWEDWTHLDDFPAGAGRYFRLNSVTGTINFGNYAPLTSPEGHGMIPPLDSEIRANTYRYVADGAKGNVAFDTVTVIRTPLSGLVAVTNPGAASDGSNEETVEETKRRGPEVLRNRYRAVTVKDYEYLVLEATTDVKKVRCLPPRLFTIYDNPPPGTNVGDPWTAYGGIDRSVNLVNVIIAPDAPLSNPTPTPSEELRQEVHDYLEERRVLTSLLQVHAPRYLPVNINVGIMIWQKALDTGLVSSTTQFEAEVETKIVEFLHPIWGGPNKQGWEVGQDLLISSLLELIQPDPEVGFIANITAQAATPLYNPPDRPFALSPGVWVQLADYELICSGTNHIVNADPI